MKAIKLASNSVALECLNDGCWARASLASILFCEWIVSLFTLDLSARQGNQSSGCLQHKYVRITGALSILLSARQSSSACPLSCDSLVTLASCPLRAASIDSTSTGDFVTGQHFNQKSHHSLAVCKCRQLVLHVSPCSSAVGIDAHNLIPASTETRFLPPQLSSHQ